MHLSVVTSLEDIQHIDLKEKVQWKATKTVPEVKQLSHRQRPADLNHPTVEERK